MTVKEAVEKVISLANNEVGYKATNGKNNKYAEYLDTLNDFYNGKKNFFDWCDLFYDWLFVKSFGEDIGRKMLYQPKKSLGAGVGYSANYYKQNNAFSTLPQRGAQIFFGNYHTGIVTDFDSTYVYTIEGNAGGGNGQVKRNTYRRNAATISGYGIPNWGLVAAVKDNKKSIEEIAKEVIAGKWGVGLERKEKLTNAGYDYTEVQNKVNYLLSHKSTEEIAKEVIAGKWGNGAARKKKLEAAGYNYSEVQKKVNELLRK